jgi:hypothetical protein
MKCVDNDTVRAIIEIVLNVYKGDVQLSTDDVEVFKKYKHVFRVLTSVRHSLSIKRKILSDNSNLVSRVIRAFNKSLK